VLTALEDWMEKGSAPANQVTTDQRNHRSRPLCECGTSPEYPGSGDANQADSFTRAPATLPRPRGERPGR
jgi:feruloyl esterase